MSEPRGFSWSLLLAALVCAVPAAVGGLVVATGGEDYRGIGFALLGFFGAGVIVLGRKAFRP